MSLRQKWEFEFLGSDLLVAARNKYDHHKKKHQEYLDTRAKIECEIKATGLEIQDSISHPGSTSPGAPPRIVVKDTMQRDLNEVTQKIQDHYNKMVGYESWVQIMKGNKTASLRLDSDDYLFFFGI